MTRRRQLTAGNTFRVDRRWYRLDEINLSTHTLVLRGPDGGMLCPRIDEFREWLGRGRAVEEGAQGGIVPGRHEAPPLPSNAEQRRWDLRVKAVEIAQAAYARDATVAEALAEVRAYGTSTPAHARLGTIARRTLDGWLADARRSGRQGLRSRYHRCGDRTERRDPLFREAVYAKVTDLQGKSRTSIEKFHTDVRGAYVDTCRQKGLEPKPHGIKTTKSILAELPQKQLDKLRLDPRTRRSLYHNAVDTVDVKHPFERVEIDSTTIDLRSMLNTNTSLRANVCAAIDVATSIILALNVSYHGPSADQVYDAIMEILTPKDEAFFQKYGIKNPIYNAYGIPDLIVFDQGAENHSQKVASMITQLGISVSFANPRKPQEKPKIERLFGSMSYDIGSLQGGTKARIYRTSKRTKESQEEAVFTIEEVNAFLQRWRYDVYHLQGIRRVS